MNGSRANTDSVAAVATVSAAAIIAHQVAGKATRDAFFLGHFDVKVLPTMFIVAALLSIGVVLLTSRLMTRLGPGRLIPSAFAVSAVLIAGEWGLSLANGKAAAVVFYLHMVSFGAVLISGFWSLINERFDPKTAKRRIGRIAGGGTLGGLIGGVLAERVGAYSDVEVMLPILAAIHLLCALLVRPLRAPPRNTPAREKSHSDSDSEAAAVGGLVTLTRVAYLRTLGALVMLGTVGAVLLDYVFKAEATGRMGGDDLLRFFAAFYTGVSLITFLVQSGLTRIALERFGLAKTVATLPGALGIGTLSAIVAPGLVSATVARGAESVVRSSLYRSSYELLFTPIPAHEKRATKSIIDVGFDRLGDAVGGGIVSLVLAAGLAWENQLLLAAGTVLAGVGLVVSSSLRRGYVRALENSLVNQAEDLEIDATQDALTRSAILQTVGALDLSGLRAKHKKPAPAAPAAQAEAAPRSTDPLIRQIEALRSGDAAQVAVALAEITGKLEGGHLPHIIPLLAWDAVSSKAIAALKGAADTATGQLLDALLNPDEPFAVRRRVPRVLCACTSQRGFDGLLLGLQDSRFEVRFQCGRALALIHRRHPHLVAHSDDVYTAIEREVKNDKRVWESQRLLDRLSDDEDPGFVDRLIKDRTSRSLEHVFALLSLALPRRPLQIAFQGLHMDDQMLRGTALEYLESVLPPHIREGLWPFLEDDRKRRGSQRSRDTILADLMKSHESFQMKIGEALKRRAEDGER